MVQIDYDGECDYDFDLIEQVSPMVEKMLGVRLKMVDEWTSKSGTGTHILIRLVPVGETPTIPLLWRSWLALVLGSDPVRERLAMMRHVLGGIDEPHLLFYPPVGYWDKEK
jgi:hypothetical protein